nr:uncharacterized protein LOC104106086 isoform X1 [Nicotiana tomentosiformis]XP_033514539.1 uncharacterized protein LOC104106086 isoform X1 [Nicotiana tomentosiformis]XP_033514540.1 uncharacterized protein LOC104106086 isoform X1 [Nicotiana tomentosiformis]XP_033514541.1 uncharacterized protein LOC104106086 isoform X1 [Nicotiana tomentosiformis]XP_033514542.1 uncharacterized protein LOC104106086 isoform X1 [Nicotiana tomentosiformis]
MKSVHGRQERKLILHNYVNQPVGPTEAVVLEFGSFLGTLARNTTLCPLDILDWRKMDTKEDIWEYTKKMSKTNIENRKKLKNPHTAGKRSFALVRSKLENDKETSDPLSPKEVFVATRKKKTGRSYMCSDEDTTSKIAEMEDIEAQQTENGNESVEAFASIMGPEHPGHLRLYGRGVTRTSLRGKVGCFEHSSNSTNCWQNMEEKIQRMEEKSEEQKTTIRQVVADVLAGLQRSGINIDANIILAALGDNSPGEASSSQQTALQPIRRPSTGSNKEG